MAMFTQLTRFLFIGMSIPTRCTGYQCHVYIRAFTRQVTFNTRITVLVTVKHTHLANRTKFNGRTMASATNYTRFYGRPMAGCTRQTGLNGLPMAGLTR